jgi:hypothetical protein
MSIVSLNEYLYNKDATPVIHFQLINCQCGGELELVDMIVANMMGRLVDSDHVVRKYCIRGLGNVGNTHETLVSIRIMNISVYNILHCTALHCTALHCTALHCNALHCTALHCTALHCTALHCTARVKILQHVNKMCSHCFFPVANKSGTSCYHLVTRSMRPTSSQQVVRTSLIPSAPNKLLTNWCQQARCNLLRTSCICLVRTTCIASLLIASLNLITRR